MRCFCTLLPDSISVLMNVLMTWRKTPSKFSLCWTWQLTHHTMRIATGWKNGPKKVIIKLADVRMLIAFEKTKISWRNWIFPRLALIILFFKHIRRCYGKNVKRLWSDKYIHAFWVSNGILRLNLTESGCLHVTTHSEDIDELFPDNELLRNDQNRTEWTRIFLFPTICTVYEK